MIKGNKQNNFSEIEKKRINYKAMLGCIAILTLSYAFIPTMLEQSSKEPPERTEANTSEEQIFLENIEQIIYNQKDIEEFEREIERIKENYLSSNETMPSSLKNMFMKMEIKFKHAKQYGKSIEETQADIYMCWVEAFTAAEKKREIESEIERKGRL